MPRVEPSEVDDRPRVGAPAAQPPIGQHHADEGRDPVADEQQEVEEVQREVPVELEEEGEEVPEEGHRGGGEHPLDLHSCCQQRQRAGVVVHRVDRDRPDEDGDHGQRGDDRPGSAEDRVDRVARLAAGRLRRHQHAQDLQPAGGQAQPQQRVPEHAAGVRAGGQVAGVVGGVEAPARTKLATMATKPTKAPTRSAPLMPSTALVSAWPWPKIEMVSTTNMAPSTNAIHFSKVWMAS